MLSLSIHANYNIIIHINFTEFSYLQSGKTILSMSALSNHGFLISRKTDLHFLECSDSNTTTVNDGGEYHYNIKIL